MIVNVLSNYINVTDLHNTKTPDTSVIDAKSVICVCPKPLQTKPDVNNRDFERPKC